MGVQTMIMSRKSKNALFNLAMIILIAFTAGAFITSPSTKARPSYVKDLPQSLKNYCNVCHAAASGGPLNVFGEDYVRLGLNINATANLDSDGDGFTNEAELAAGTFPGDPNSYPGSSSQSTPLVELIVLAIVSSSFVLLAFGFYRRKGKAKPARETSIQKSNPKESQIDSHLKTPNMRAEHNLKPFLELLKKRRGVVYNMQLF